MKPKRRSSSKGTWTSEVDGQEVELTGKQVIVMNKDGTVKRRAFKAKGELPGGVKMKVKDKTRFK